MDNPENTEGAIKNGQRNWQHRVHETMKNKEETQNNVLDTIIHEQTKTTCWTTLYINKQNQCAGHHYTQTNKTMCWTPLYKNNVNKT